MSTATPGHSFYGMIKALDPSVEPTSHLMARSAGRLLEEAVELALAFGLGSKEVMGHVADALHNEAKKAKCFPTELKTEPDRAEQLVELGDVSILISYLAVLSGVTPEELDKQQWEKVFKLTHAITAGECVVIDGLLYRKASRA